MNTNNYNFRVAIHCMTYNHKPFIRQCLDGFVMQKTDFPFVAIVVDDASTDNEQEVLWDFINNELDPSSLQKDETDDYVRLVSPHKTNNNCFFAVYFLKYNHYSIRKAKSPYLKDLEDSAKYIAFCEGDDYWTDPNKLQKQVDYLEVLPKCSMVCNRTKRFSEKNHIFISDSSCLEKDGCLKVEDVIRKGGLYIPTCSIVYRKELKDNYPDYCNQCHVGDYPLQIMAAMKGKIYYINDSMSVYRVENSNSWVGRQNYLCGFEKRKNGVVSEIRMLEGFANQFPKKRKWLYQRIARFINMEFSKWKHDRNAIIELRKTFNDEINNYSLLWKIDLYFTNKNHGLFKRLYMAIAWRTFYKLYEA